VTAVASCRICKNELESWEHRGLCNRCRDRLGIIDMPPARRPLAPCGKCSGTKLVRVIPRDHTATGGRYVESTAVPMRLSIVPTTAAGIFSSREHVEPPDPSSGRGQLEAYVCRACGFVEWYCNDPENIPIGPEYMTEEIDVGSGPYR
jgi:hypothetical protein